MVKDPVCGMEIDPKAAKFKLEKGDKVFYFCSQECMDSFKQDNLLLTVGLSAVLIAIAALSYLFGVMPLFMGVLLLLLSGLKFLDLDGFAAAFARYDILAKRSGAYAHVYPFFELALSLMYLFSFQVRAAAIMTALVFAIGTIGVAKNLMSKVKVRCACVGTKINLPLTQFTFVEDLVMVVMGIMLFLK